MSLRLTDSCYQPLREVPAGPLWFDPGGWKKARVFQGFICCTLPISPLRRGGQRTELSLLSAPLSTPRLTAHHILFAVLGFVLYLTTDSQNLIIQSGNSTSDVRRNPSGVEPIQSSGTASGRSVTIESLSDGKQGPNVPFYYY